MKKKAQKNLLKPSVKKTLGTLRIFFLYIYKKINYETSEAVLEVILQYKISHIPESKNQLTGEKAQFWKNDRAIKPTVILI